MALFPQFHRKKSNSEGAAIPAIPAIPDPYVSRNSHYSQNSHPPVFKIGTGEADANHILRSTPDAKNTILWLRRNGVAITLSPDGRRPVLSGVTVADLSPSFLSRVQDLSSEIVDLLYEERKSAAASRQQFKNSEPWNWPDDLDDAIRIARQRNQATEQRRETARYCICGWLAENEWTTTRGKMWICEPCRDSGLLDMLQGNEAVIREESKSHEK